MGLRPGGLEDEELAADQFQGWALHGLVKELVARINGTWLMKCWKQGLNNYALY